MTKTNKKYTNIINSNLGIDVVGTGETVYFYGNSYKVVKIIKGLDSDTLIIKNGELQQQVTNHDCSIKGE